ncbi:MAG: hypothetical protein HOB05_05480 [Bacteroidetes bacterium]|jgi:P27 family predicted phage terminase small subunit|nr:hypothetical protein [Bacteroidota bacterium]MBT7143940.1 hypothetical protein [Bacteroidota bacterium]
MKDVVKLKRNAKGQGRKKLPKAIKEAQGTLRKCRENENEPQHEVLLSYPVPVEILKSDYAIDIYERVFDYLKGFGITSTVNIDLIIQYAFQMNVWMEFVKIVNEKGVMLSGRVAPAVYGMKSAGALALKYAGELGITPAQHSKLIANMPDEIEVSDRDFA